MRLAWTAVRRGLALLVAVAAFLALFWYLLVQLPPVVAPLPPAGRDKVSEDQVQDDTDRLKIQSDTRSLVVQGLGGLVVAVGASITYRQYREQKRAGRASFYLEQLTRSLPFLTSDDAAVRVSGVHALHRLAVHSADDRVTVVQMLTTFVLDRSTPNPGVQTVQDGPKLRELRNRTPDLQAALWALGQHNYLWYGSERWRLRYVDLRRAPFKGLHFDGTAFTEARLGAIWAPGATFRGCSFRGASLAEANLRDVDLRGARLRQAELRGADLAGADLTGTVFDAGTQWPAEPDASGAIARGARVVPQDATPTAGDVGNLQPF